MFRTEYASIRVPDIYDTDMAESVRAMMADIQYRLYQNQVRVDELKRRRGARAYAGGAQVINSGVLTTVQYATESYDSDGYVDLGSSSTNFSIPKGLFFFSFNGLLTGGTINTAYAEIIGSTYGTICANQCGPFTYTTIASISTVGLMYSTVAQTVTARVLQISGSAGVIATGYLQVARIGNY